MMGAIGYNLEDFFSEQTGLCLLYNGFKNLEYMIITSFTSTTGLNVYISLPQVTCAWGGEIYIVTVITLR